MAASKHQLRHRNDETELGDQKRSQHRGVERHSVELCRCVWYTRITSGHGSQSGEHAALSASTCETKNERGVTKRRTTHDDPREAEETERRGENERTDLLQQPSHLDLHVLDYPPRVRDM